MIVKANSEKNGLAILNMVFFVFIFTMLAGVILRITASHTILVEHHIRKGKAFYVAEAGLVSSMDAMRRGTAPIPVSVPWSLNVLTSLPMGIKTAIVDVTPSAGWEGADIVESNCTYTLNF